MQLFNAIQDVVSRNSPNQGLTQQQVRALNRFARNGLLQRMLIDAMLTNQQRTQELEEQLQQERTINAVQRAISQVQQQQDQRSRNNDSDDQDMPDMGALMQMANAMMAGQAAGAASRGFAPQPSGPPPQSTSVRLPGQFTDANGNGITGNQPQGYTPPGGGYTPQGGVFSPGVYPGPPSTPAPLTAPCCQASTPVPPVIATQPQPVQKALIGYIVRPNILGFRPGPFDGLGLNSFNGIGGFPVPLAVPALAG